jgi:hypothetical protein
LAFLLFDYNSSPPPPQPLKTAWHTDCHTPSAISLFNILAQLRPVRPIYASRRLSPFPLIILSIVLILFLCIISDHALIYLDQACSLLSILHLILYTIVVLPSSSPPTLPNTRHCSFISRFQYLYYPWVCVTGISCILSMHFSVGFCPFHIHIPSPSLSHNRFLYISRTTCRKRGRIDSSSRVFVVGIGHSNIRITVLHSLLIVRS